MEEDKPSYYAIIPAEVRYSKIPPNAKLLYGEITALCSKEGFCWASNEYFATLYEVSHKTISSWIKALKEKGFITYELAKGYLRKIFLVGGGHNKKVMGALQKGNGGHNKKVMHSNTVSNTSNIATPKVVAEVEPFNSNAYIEEMIKDKRKNIVIIGRYFKIKKANFPSLKAIQAEIKRNLIISNVLAEYDDSRIARTVEFVKVEYPSIWTLETVGKKIIKPLN